MLRSFVAAAAACLLAAAVPQPASAVTREVVPSCRYTYQTVPNSNDILLTVIAEAHATGPDVAVTTSVVCVATTFFGETVTARTSTPGADVYAVSSGRVRWSSPALCVDAQAKFVPTSGVLSIHGADHPGDCGVDFPL